MSDPTHPPSTPRKPPWLKRRLPTDSSFQEVRALIEKGRLHTVCQEAKCPNIWECYARQTATFLIMGGRCTRNCRFCSVAPGTPEPLDPQEPVRVAAAAARMGLKYAVVTSVTRDDLPDGGAAHFAATIREIRRRIPGTLVEVLIPDFQGDRSALLTRAGSPAGRAEPQHRKCPPALSAGAAAGGLPSVAGAFETRPGIRPGPRHQVRADAGTGRATPGGAPHPAGPARGGLPHPDARPIPAALAGASAGGALCDTRGVRELALVRAGDGLCRSRQRPLRAQLVSRARKLPGAARR